MEMWTNPDIRICPQWMIHNGWQWMVKTGGMCKIDQFDWCPGLNETTAIKPGNLSNNITLLCLYKSWNITLIITQPPPARDFYCKALALPVWMILKESPVYQSKNKLVHHFCCCIGHLCASLLQKGRSFSFQFYYISIKYRTPCPPPLHPNTPTHLKLPLHHISALKKRRLM